MQTKTNALLKEYIIREKVLKLQCKSLQFLNILECNKRTKNRKKTTLCSSWNLSTLSSNRALCIAQGSFMYLLS